MKPMKPKNPNGHYPPGIPPGGRVLQLPDSAAEAVQRELVQKLQPHLNELNQENASEERATSLVFAAAIKHHGVEAVAGLLFEKTFDLAVKLSQRNLKRCHEKAFELFAEKRTKPAHIPPHIIRSAGRQGVVLLEPITFEPGEVVTNCGKRMTVDKQDGNVVECVWFDEANALQRDTFAAAMLERFSADAGSPAES